MLPGSAGHMSWCGRGAPGGELRAGRRNRRRLAGPRHGRAAGQRRGGLAAPPAHRRSSPQGLRGAVPVSGFQWRRKEGCGEGSAPGSPRLGAAGVNAPKRTGPGQRGRRGEERPSAGATVPLLRPAQRRSWGGSPGSLRGGPPRGRQPARPHAAGLRGGAAGRARRGLAAPRPPRQSCFSFPSWWRKFSKHTGV